MRATVHGGRVTGEDVLGFSGILLAPLVTLTGMSVGVAAKVVKRYQGVETGRI